MTLARNDSWASFGKPDYYLSFFEVNFDAIGGYEAGVDEIASLEPDAWGVFMVADGGG